MPRAARYGDCLKMPGKTAVALRRRCLPVGRDKERAPCVVDRAALRIAPRMAIVLRHSPAPAPGGVAARNRSRAGRRAITSPCKSSHCFSRICRRETASCAEAMLHRTAWLQRATQSFFRPSSRARHRRPRLHGLRSTGNHIFKIRHALSLRSPRLELLARTAASNQNEIQASVNLSARPGLTQVNASRGVLV